MTIYTSIKMAFDAILSNKARAFLTVLGIIIGISAVIALLSVGQGAQSQILEQVQGLGSNTINLFPVANFNGPTSRASFQALLQNRIDYHVVDLLKNEVTFREVIAISPEVSKSVEVTHRSRSELVSVYGVTPDYFIVRDVSIDRGRLLSERDNTSYERVVVLGAEVAGKLFGENTAVGEKVSIDGTNYTVIGVAQSKSGTIDGQAYVPLNTATSVLTGSKDLNQIAVKVVDENVVDSAAIKIEDELKDYFRVTDLDDANISITTSKDFLELAGSITSIFTTLLASIAGISLIVGGIGIMNIMLVSVSERTKEIGLRKAVGAKQTAIMSQFLIESIVLTVLGGIIGIILGLLMGFAIGHFGGIAVIVSWQAIALATSVSISIGLVFGFYPAYRASKLDPIVALRYE